MLTAKQHELLLYIEQYQDSYGISPSFDEMRISLRLKSKSGIHRLLVALEERGFIRKLAHRARALEVIKKTPRGTNSFTNTDVTESPHYHVSNPPSIRMSSTISLPCMGRIAAGTPIDAIADSTNYIEVPQHMIQNGTFYALQVGGDSMVNAGIIDGDTLIIEKANHAEKGQIVVALIERDEATLKYFYPDNDMIILKAANPDYSDQHYNPEQVQIQGKLHALLRQYD